MSRSPSQTLAMYLWSLALTGHPSVLVMAGSESSARSAMTEMDRLLSTMNSADSDVTNAALAETP